MGKLELKPSNMSSDPGCRILSYSNNSYSNFQQGKERNADYADHDDIDLEENQAYDNKVEPMLPDEPDRIKNRRRISNNVISVISATVLAGCVIVICMILRCIVLRGTACYFQYRIALSNATEIRLIKETRDNRLTLFNVTSLANNSEQILSDEKNTMTFNVSVNDTDIEVSVYISDTQCNHHGTYSILAISDENGFEEYFVSVKVIALCPCQVDLSIASIGEITCSFPNAENTSIFIQKVSGEMQTFLVNGSEIIRHLDLQATNGFSATWSTDGTLNVKLVLGLLNCSHEGDYNISVTMNGTSLVYDVHLHVIDHPQTPEIADARNGILEGTGGIISCRAMTGCNNAHLKFELSSSGNDKWDIWRKTNQSVSTINKLGWETQFLTTISADQVTYIDKRKFRCSYMFNREIYTSNALCIRVIPGNLCPMLL
ncbi:hypothetical protein ACJMK2_017975 [Sinanodonta woodiana]|uniref:Ig-like domain-containing protein n=1 Tax=Sinanodonta woodiana TaxID=1069815 RepID=A0ABD3UC02_SINWO